MNTDTQQWIITTGLKIKFLYTARHIMENSIIIKRRSASIEHPIYFV